MPFDSEGNFTRIHNWEDDRINDIDIVTDHHDEEDNNFAEGLSQCMLRDGRSPLKGDLNLSGFKVKNLGDGTADYDAINRGQLEKSISDQNNTLTELLNKLWKIGDIKASVKNSNHDNWFLCNGQAINRVTYSELFSLIGTKFGAGDGTTTFNLPDYRGKFLRGLGGNSAADIYTTQAEGLPNITGNVVGGRENSKAVSGAFANNGKDTTASMFDGGNDQDTRFGISSFDASRSSSVYGKSQHVTPINQAVNYFIKVKEEK